MMIILNNKRFAKNNAEFIDSLFNNGPTCTGFYKVNKQSITIQDQQRQKIGVINKHGVLCKASRPDCLNGNYWYTLATIDVIGKYCDYMQSVNEPLNALQLEGIL